MGVLGKYGGNALKYWGSILTSAYQRLSTADMWTAIHNQQQEYGLPKPGASAPDVSVIRGYANRIVAGSMLLNAADSSDSITADMMATAPYTTRDLNAISTAPVYHVRYQNMVELPDGTITQTWHTSIFTAADFPDTVGALRDAIDTHASELAAQGSESSTTTPRGKSIFTSNLEITLVLRHARPGALPGVERLDMDPAGRPHPRHGDPRHPGLSRSSAAAMLACPRRHTATRDTAHR